MYKTGATKKPVSTFSSFVCARSKFKIALALGKAFFDDFDWSIVSLGANFKVVILAAILWKFAKWTDSPGLRPGTEFCVHLRKV